VPSIVVRREFPPRKTLSIRARRVASMASKVQPPTPSILEQLTPDIDPRPFLAEVRENLDDGTLHYSDRIRLLQSAQRYGIGRFEANLLIAVVQHRNARSASHGMEALPQRRSRRRWKIAAGIAVAIASEFCLLRIALHAFF
jgi:hypothetical protein